MRNIGGSIHLDRRGALAETPRSSIRARRHLRPDNPLAQVPFLAHPFSLTPVRPRRARRRATARAAMVAYSDDFKLMMPLVILASPLILLLRTPRRPRAAAAPAAAE
jgi:DHA2 family multidrug resistance protein